MPKHRPRRQSRAVARRTAVAFAGGALAVLPVLTAGLPAPVAVQTTTNSGVPPALAAPQQAPAVVIPPIAVDGSLPQPPTPEPLVAPGGHAGSAGISGSLGIPASMMKAYQNAAGILGAEQPKCHVDWPLIASIGRIESNHARGGFVDAHGNTLERILGPQLNGTGGFAAIADTDGGKYDGDTTWDHAVGPMQFIPSTWRGYASDGNADGVSDPNNIYDETLAAARYLCSGGPDLTSIEVQRIAVRRYNPSDSYVDTVMAWATAYRGGVSQLPDSTVPIGAPPPPDNAAAAGPVTPPNLPPQQNPAPPRSPTSPVIPTKSSTTTTKPTDTTTKPTDTTKP